MLYTPNQLEQIYSRCTTYKIQQKKGEWMEFLGLLNQTDKKYKNVVEVGCYDGGTTIGLSYFTDNLISLDIIYPPRFSDQEIKKNCNFTYLALNSFDPSTVAKIKTMIDGIDVLFLDGDHNYEKVKLDYDLYRGFMKPGGIIAFHDIADELALPHIRYVWTLWKELRKLPNTLEFYYDGAGRKFKIEEYDYNHDGGSLRWGGIGVIMV